MRLTVLAILLTSAAVLPATAGEGPVTLSPEDIGHIFCLSRLGNDTGPIDGLLSDDLATTIAEAEELNVQWEEANPGEKPPLGDGIPWQSWPDYAPNCTVQAVTIEGRTARVPIEYRFPDTPHAEYIDTLVLTEIDHGYGWMVWRIDTIAYDTGSDLKSLLGGAFDTP